MPKIVVKGSTDNSKNSSGQGNSNLMPHIASKFLQMLGIGNGSHDKDSMDYHQGREDEELEGAGAKGGDQHADSLHPKLRVLAAQINGKPGEEEEDKEKNGMNSNPMTKNSPSMNSVYSMPGRA